MVQYVQRGKNSGPIVLWKKTMLRWNVSDMGRTDISDISERFFISTE
jgi:hypothetical protein